jgi:hypothetical protein
MKRTRFLRLVDPGALIVALMVLAVMAAPAAAQEDPAEQAGAQAEEAAQEATQQAEEAAQEVTEDVEEAAQEATEQAEEAAQEATEQAESAAEEAVAPAAAVRQTAEAPEPAEPQMAQAQKVFRHESTIIIDGKTEANGVLTLIFEPNGAEAKQVRLNVPAKMNAKKIAKELANQFAFTVGANYKVKQDNKQVRVKAKKKKVAPFWIGIDQQALTGVAVRVTK